MSYLVLARKWRPQTFHDLIGQEHVSQTLKNAIDSGRVAHAFLFTGARGVGKTSSARILAKTLNCEQGPSTEPCNVCPACKEITGGTAVDVFEIDGASNTSVDDIRELRENIKYLPSRCRFKIFIIDEVHMLSMSAFNALLKTLEEPPPHVKFIFATTEPHKVPITILSRCQRFDFRRIPLPTIVARLRYIVGEEGVEISDAALTMIARKGDGSMRDSLSSLDQVLAFCGNRADDETVTTLLGVIDRRLLLETSQAVFARNSRAVLDIVRRVDAFGYNMRFFCQDLIDHFRTVTIMKAVGENADLPDLAEGELAEIRSLLPAVELADLQRYLPILLKAEGEMPLSAFPRLVLEMALLKMATMPPVVPVDVLLDRLSAIEARLAGGMVSSSTPTWEKPSRSVPEKGHRPAALEEGGAKAVPKHSSPQTAPRQELPVGEKGWDGFVAYVRGKKRLLASLLEHGRPLSVSERRLDIGFLPDSFQLRQTQDPDVIADLKALAKAFFGTEIEVKLVAVAETSGTPPTLVEKKTLEAATRRQQLEQQANDHPLVKAALEILGGEIAAIAEPEKPS